ncbi:hypothetical protein ACWGB8_01645 [Kitasatospora sp. NPDC054939]
MTQPAAPLDLDAIKARADAATPGPWTADSHEIYQGTPDDCLPDPTWIGETCNVDLPDHGAANARFIAHARVDVPALVAALCVDESTVATLLNQNARLAEKDAA